MDKIYEICSLLPRDIEKSITSLPRDKLFAITEIRIKAKSPICVLLQNELLFLSKSCHLTKIMQNPYIPSSEVVHDIFLKICKNSVYAKERELRGGFVTYSGCRCGIFGRYATDADGSISGYSRVDGINIRIARDMRGCSSDLFDIVLQNNQLHSTLLVAPPCTGKTTMLRDVARKLSTKQIRTALADERGELSGEGSFELGTNCYPIIGVPKHQAVEMAVRTLNPTVVIIDEIGDESEIDKLLSCVNTGVTFIASAHANDIYQLLLRPQFKKLQEAQVLDKIVILQEREVGKIKAVYNAKEVQNENFRLNYNGFELCANL